MSGATLVLPTGLTSAPPLSAGSISLGTGVGPPGALAVSDGSSIRWEPPVMQKATGDEVLKAVVYVYFKELYHPNNYARHKTLNWENVTRWLCEMSWDFIGGLHAELYLEVKHGTESACDTLKNLYLRAAATHAGVLYGSNYYQEWNSMQGNLQYLDRMCAILATPANPDVLETVLGLSRFRIFKP